MLKNALAALLGACLLSSCGGSDTVVDGGDSGRQDAAPASVRCPNGSAHLEVVRRVATGLPGEAAARVVGMVWGGDGLYILVGPGPGAPQACLATLAKLDGTTLALSSMSSVVLPCAAGSQVSSPLAGLAYDGSSLLTLGGCDDSSSQGLVRLPTTGGRGAAERCLSGSSVALAVMAAAEGTLAYLQSSGTISVWMGAGRTGFVDPPPDLPGPSNSLSFEDDAFWIGRSVFEGNMRYTVTRVPRFGDGACVFPLEVEADVHGSFPAVHGERVFVFEPDRASVVELRYAPR